MTSAEAHPTRVGYWLSEKKQKKLHFQAFKEDCLRTVGIELVPLDLDGDLVAQGPFAGIIHKISDLLLLHVDGDETATRQCRNLHNYLNSGDAAGTVVMDPLPSVRMLCDRNMQYSLLRICAFAGEGILTPNFVDLTDPSVEEMKKKLASSGLRFPMLIKPLLAHSHKMSVIFSEEQLNSVEVPCVAQTYIPHNAVLFKVFVLGNRHFTITRPSLRNLQPHQKEPIRFDSHELSKDGCSHDLSVEEDGPAEVVEPSEVEVEAAVRSLRQCTGLSLFGIDLIVDRDTGRAFAIDVNGFPSYDGIPNFMDELKAFLVRMVRPREWRDEGTDMETPHMLQPPHLASPPLGYESDTEGPRKDRRRGDAAPIVHLRSISDVSEYETKSKTLPDSGVGSCSESETSDCEKKIKEMALARQQKHQFSVHPRPSLSLGCDFQPSWPRIKRFYGIPRPLAPPARATRRPSVLLEGTSSADSSAPGTPALTPTLTSTLITTLTPPTKPRADSSP